MPFDISLVTALCSSTAAAVDAILDGTPLMVPGEEGIHSVELANVMLYSSLINQTVDLPMDSAAFEKKLQQLIADTSLEDCGRLVSGARAIERAAHTRGVQAGFGFERTSH